MDETTLQSLATVVRVYEAAFNRPPETDGLSYWTNYLSQPENDLLDMAALFLGTPEAQSFYGANPSNADFVAALYDNVLGRPGEADGVAFWTGNLDNGAFSQAQVLAAIAESAENVAGTAEAVAGLLDAYSASASATAAFIA